MKNREWIEQQIKKKFWIRLSFLSLVLAIWTILDEWIKEGYTFSIRDIGNPYSHETLAVLLTIVAILSYLRHRFRGGGVAWVGVNQLKELQMNLLV